MPPDKVFKFRSSRFPVMEACRDLPHLPRLIDLAANTPNNQCRPTKFSKFRSSRCPVMEAGRDLPHLPRLIDLAANTPNNQCRPTKFSSSGQVGSPLWRPAEISLIYRG